jgi:hypothetical protein
MRRFRCFLLQSGEHLFVGRKRRAFQRDTISDLLARSRNARSDLNTYIGPSRKELNMRSILLLLLGVPIPIIILFALFVR